MVVAAHRHHIIRIILEFSPRVSGGLVYFRVYVDDIGNPILPIPMRIAECSG